jgi:hypothetical protein
MAIQDNCKRYFEVGIGEALVNVQARVLEPPYLDCGGTVSIYFTII